jgi:hypothetical protein
MSHHTLIIKDERGTVVIEVSIWGDKNFPDADGRFWRYDVTSYYIPAGKRKPVYNDLSTDAEKQQAKTELWQKLKP